MPVTLEKRKSPMMAKGANFSERNRGALRGNFIQNNLQGYLIKGCYSFGATTQMVHRGPQLLFYYANYACKFLKMMYLNGSPGSVDLSEQFIMTQKTRHFFEADLLDSRYWRGV
jgi:hypothetical protein